MKRTIILLTRSLFKNFRSYEKAAFIYLISTALLALLRQDLVEGWRVVILLHTILISIILLLTRRKKTNNPYLSFLRDWYVLLFTPFLFKEISVLSKALFSYYPESFLISLEINLKMFYLNYLSFIKPAYWLTELMSITYLSYYILILTIGLKIRSKNSDDAFEFYMFKITLTLFICYYLFILMPARGPHHSLYGSHPGNLNGGFFYQAILFVQSQGSAVGAAFPSAHVAVAWTSLFALRKNQRLFYKITLPIIILLTISAFYLRYHYVIDAVAGFVIAVILEKLYSRKNTVNLQI